MQKRWGIFLLCLGVILPAKGQDSLFDNYKPRSARVEFIVNERGRAQNPTITENESALPEPTVLQRLAWMTFPVKLAGRKSRVLIEFNTPWELAAATAPVPAHTDDGRPIFGDNETDRPIMMLRKSADSLSWDGTNYDGPQIAYGRLIVDEAGRVLRCDVLYAYPKAMGKKATRKLLKLQFEPPIKEGKAVCGWVDVPWIYLPSPGVHVTGGR
jgi:hypothetical protein